MTDRELIRKIQRGQKDYLTEIIEKYYDDIFRFCVYQTGNADASYDLTQETFLRFIKYVDNYKYQNLKGYLLMIARNICIDYFREEKKSSCLEETLIRGAITRSAEEIGEEDKQLAGVDNKLFLQKALGKLPVEQREVVIMYYYNGMKLREISKLSGTNLSTVKSRLKLAVKKLQKEMGC